MTTNRSNGSNPLTTGPARAAARAMLKAVGFSDADLKKPLIGVANTWIEIGPCNYHLRRLAAKVKEGIRAAGGTPMAIRRNALVGAGYVIAAVNDIGIAFAADEGRTTTTRIESFPNLPGTYAEQVKLTIDFRHIDPARFEAMRRQIDAAIAAAARKANVEIEVAEGWSWGTELFAPECIELLKTTARELGLPYREMRSQAGHDAYAVATVAPTAMIFTPCIEGISHNVREAIELARSVPGANLLLNAAVARANR